MAGTSTTRGVIAALVGAFVALGSVVSAQPGQLSGRTEPGTPASATVPMLKDVGIDQKLDAAVPLDIAFVDEQGRDVRLGDYFGKKPVVLALVYYECPMLCTLVLNGLVGSLETVNFTAGKDFDVVVVSFDPGETPALAAAKKATYLGRYNRPGAEAGFHFLTGRQESITRLTDAVGFRYKYDPSIDQFAHPAAITVLTPGGHVSRYLYGVEFVPRDLRLALVEAADNKIGGLVDQVLLFCYHYDPLSGKYGFVILNGVRLGGILTLAGLAASIWLTVRRDRRQASAAAHTATGVR